MIFSSVLRQYNLMLGLEVLLSFPDFLALTHDMSYYFFPVRFPTESHVLIGWRAVLFSPYEPRNRTAPLVEQVLSKQVFLLIFFEKFGCHYHTRMDNKSIHSESEFYLYPEEQDKEND